MQSVSLKLDDSLDREIDRCMKAARYSTKTEFIREAIRDKVCLVREQQAKEKAWDALFAARGVFKGKGKAKTDEEWYEWRKEYGEKLAGKLAKKYNLKL